MMLRRLQIKDLRLFETARLELSPGVNLILGPNGAGKTTILEAVHLLGQGRTFRHREAGPLVRHGQKALVVVAELLDDEGRHHRLGVERDQKSFRARLDGEDLRQRSRLLRTLPLQIFTPRSHELVEAGPELRRQFIDQALFHVEHAYHQLIQTFMRALKQRNRALRSKDLLLAKSFEPALIETSVALDNHRRTFIDRLSPAVEKILSFLEPDLELEIDYRPGWQGSGFAQSLEESRDLDLERGFTSKGPQRAELVLKSHGLPVSRRYSRGQQKLLVYALGLAAAQLIQASSGRSPVLLADDLPSELDTGRMNRLVEFIKTTGLQALITALDGAPLDTDGVKVFHVEHGTVSEG